MPPKIIRVPANADLDKIIDQLSDSDQSSEFTDEELTPHEMEVTIVVELALKWLIDGDAKRAAAPTKKQFLEVISTFCSLDRYMSPKDILDILDILGVVKEQDHRELIFNQAFIAEIQRNKDKYLEPVIVKFVLEDMSRRKELNHCYASGIPASKSKQPQIPLLNDPIAMKALRYTVADNIDDLKVVVERTLFWIHDNSSIPSNIHEFLHSLTPFCGVKHTVSEKEAFNEMVQKGYVLQVPKVTKSKEFMDEKMDLDENTIITLAPKGKAILDLKKQDNRNKILASCTFLLLFLLVFVFVPLYIL